MRKTILFALIAALGFSCNSKITKEETNASVPIKREVPPEYQRVFDKREVKFLKEDFICLTTSNGKEEGLFPIQSTGVSTQPIKIACEALLNGLTKEQLTKVHFELEDEEWRRWCNVGNGAYTRQGVSIKEMNQVQRKLAFDLMGKSLIAKGLKLSKDIMKTDQTLHELNDNDPFLDEELYYFTIMGTPSMTEPWGWQIDGHHLVINYFILGDQVVMTPTFMGAEPVIATTGKYKGNTLFQDEQNLGLKLMQSLTTKQQKQATLSETKEHRDIQAEAFKDNAVIDYQGLPISEMTEPQQEQLLHLTALYINNMKEGHAKVRMEEIKKHLDKTFFAWTGATDEEAIFYYRIHSPVILIEFDHQGPIGMKGDRKQATRNHIHTIVRTPNGNDYGKDLLRQHLEEHHSHYLVSPRYGRVSYLQESDASESVRLLTYRSGFFILIYKF
ncbi:MAG: DUF3500 domain-containing protein [Bacteroidota bacterium]